MKKYKRLAIILLCAAALCGCAAAPVQVQSAAFFCMDTIVEQQVYGSDAQQVMQQVQTELQQFDNTLSMYNESSEISKINASRTPVQVSGRTLALLQQGKELSRQSDNAFALTIAPLSRAWNITGDNPRVLSQPEIDALLPLVNDEDIIIDEKDKTVYLAANGQGIDLGGIAKGTACNVAKEVYENSRTQAALLSIGGNVYAYGVKPDGNRFRVGFRDPAGSAETYIASFEMQDSVFAVSGGYERYFEQNGIRYIHIIDPATGAPAQSDIVSVGVMNPDGTQADFWSTTLFIWGKEKTLDYMRAGGTVIMLDGEKRLYVSASLKDSFVLADSAQGAYTVEYIAEDTAYAK